MNKQKILSQLMCNRTECRNCPAVKYDICCKDYIRIRKEIALNIIDIINTKEEKKNEN